MKLVNQSFTMFRLERQPDLCHGARMARRTPMAGGFFLMAAIIGGAWFLWRAIVFMRPENRDVAARKLFFTSIGYLPLVLCALVADRMLFGQ